MKLLIFYSLIGGVFSLLGGILLLWRANLAKKFMLPLLSFAAGAFIATSLLDILPKAIESISEVHTLMIAVVTGFALFFAMERFSMRYSAITAHSHDHADHTESLPFLIITGDTLHNFLDGILIGISFLADPSIGLATTLAVAAHEIPQEIGDFAVLLNQGWQRSRVLMVNIFQSLMTIPGVLLGFYGGQMVSNYLPYLLGATAGIFLYLGASDLIPEIHHRAGHKHFFHVIAYFLLSVIIVGWLTQLAHAK